MSRRAFEISHLQSEKNPFSPLFHHLSLELCPNLNFPMFVWFCSRFCRTEFLKEFNKINEQNTESRHTWLMLHCRLWNNAVCLPKRHDKKKPPLSKVMRCLAIYCCYWLSVVKSIHPSSSTALFCASAVQYQEQDMNWHNTKFCITQKGEPHKSCLARSEKRQCILLECGVVNAAQLNLLYTRYNVS